MESAISVYAERAVTTAQRVAKRARRKRLPAPKCRTPLASIRRFNSLVTLFIRELGRDLLTAEREMVRQAAAIMLRAEQLQAAIVTGAEIDPDELIRLSSEGRRILRSIKAGAKLETPPPLWSPLRSRLSAATEAPTPKTE